MRAVAVILAALALSACVSATSQGGDANYDTLAKAEAACAAKGGELRLRKFGNPEVISSYACHRK